MTQQREHEREPLGEDTQFAVELGAAIHNLMWRKKLSARKIAPLVGLSQSTLSAKLRGDAKIAVIELVRLARVLEVDPADLLPDVEPAAPTDQGVTHPYVYAVATAEIAAYADVIDLAQERSRRAS